MLSPSSYIIMHKLERVTEYYYDCMGETTHGYVHIHATISDVMAMYHKTNNY